MLGGDGRETRPDLRGFFGRQVWVTVDRPLGSRHPAHSDLRYPVHDGFLPGTTSGDGQPIDAYVAGCDEAVADAGGIVVALVVRAIDVEDRLVVAADGRRRSAEEITGLIAFQERFFASRVVVAGDDVAADVEAR